MQQDLNPSVFHHLEYFVVDFQVVDYHLRVVGGPSTYQNWVPVSSRLEPRELLFYYPYSAWDREQRPGEDAAYGRISSN